MAYDNKEIIKRSNASITWTTINNSDDFTVTKNGKFFVKWNVRTSNGELTTIKTYYNATPKNKAFVAKSLGRLAVRD